MNKEQIRRFRIVIGAIALVSLLTQNVVGPWTAADLAEAYPEVAYLAVPYGTAIVVAIGAFEVALLAAWQMLPATAGDEALASRSKRWANVMVVALIPAAFALKRKAMSFSPEDDVLPAGSGK